MKLGIMQPYFFPYLNYFSLIASTDKWVIFDSPQYTPRTWMNRNRILHPKEGWQYLTVPVIKSSQTKNIHEIQVDNLSKTKEKLLAQIDHYRKKAPYFVEVKQLIEYCFDRIMVPSLSTLNVESISAVCQYLDVSFNFTYSSKEKYKFKKPMHPGGWALEISSELGASEYVNPLGGRTLFKPTEFKERKIKLSFLSLEKFDYNCSPYKFIEHLSVIDVLMWNHPNKVRDVIFNPVITT